MMNGQVVAVPDFAVDSLIDHLKTRLDDDVAGFAITRTPDDRRFVDVQLKTGDHVYYAEE